MVRGENILMGKDREAKYVNKITTNLIQDFKNEPQEYNLREIDLLH